MTYLTLITAIFAGQHQQQPSSDLLPHWTTQHPHLTTSCSPICQNHPKYCLSAVMKVSKIWAPASYVLLLLQQQPELCEGHTLPANETLSGCEMEVLTGISSYLGCQCPSCLSVCLSV